MCCYLSFGIQSETLQGQLLILCGKFMFGDGYIWNKN